MTEKKEIKEITKVKITKIKIEGDLVQGKYNFIEFSKENINYGGIDMVIELLEAITGVAYDAPLEWIFPGEKGRLYSLKDYLIQILEEKGLTIQICGNCGYYEPSGGPSPLLKWPDDIKINIGYCKKMDEFSMFCVRAFGEQCGFSRESNWTWIPKEIPSEKKEEEKTCGNCGKSGFCKEFASYAEAENNNPCERWIMEKNTEEKKQEEKTCGNCVRWPTKFFAIDGEYCEVSSRKISNATPACDIWSEE